MTNRNAPKRRGRSMRRAVEARRARMRSLPLDRMTRSEVAETLGVSERTVMRDEEAIGRTCRLHSRAEITSLGGRARQEQRRQPTQEDREREVAQMMARWMRRPIVGVAA